MKKIQKIQFGVLMFIALSIAVSCKKEVVENNSTPIVNDKQSDLKVVPCVSCCNNCPANIIEPAPTIPNATLFANKPYDTYAATTFDIYVPNSALSPNAPAVPLVIFVHGGGFCCGDKSDAYETTNNPFDGDIQYYIDNNIAFATVNYRLGDDLPNINTEGARILKSMNDVKHCLQYIRYNAATYNIDKSKVGMFGSSAGGGASAYLGFNANMPEPITVLKPYLGESTRLQAIGHNNSQTSYSPYELNQIFSVNYACSGPSVIPLPHVSVSALDFTSKVTSDDPFIYIRQKKLTGCPLNYGESIHHPYQAKTLYDAAKAMGEIVTGNSEITAFQGQGINQVPPPIKSLRDFMIDRLN
jgi:predicted esterase